MTSSTGNKADAVNAHTAQTLYVMYRIHVAVTGAVVVAAMFAVTQASWITGGQSGNSTLWQAGSVVGPIGNWTVFVLIVTLVLAVIAAYGARTSWAIAAAVTGSVQFFLILIVSDDASSAQNAFNGHYSPTGAVILAVVLTVLLVIWALVVAVSSWNRRDQAAKALNPF